ncbi:AbrB family transcriptional regulator [Robertmurraya massiliosenegalensis]|uniref:AbrB family transcriptional regulator n=1 Tax=Robertmurraya TaxID=2837507 RepID=UPI0039A727FD
MIIVVYIVSIVIVGTIFNLLHIPAGWLVGPILTGVVFKLAFERVFLPDIMFKIALSLLGVNIGLIMDVHFFLILKDYLTPLFICLVITIVGALLIGKFLFRFTDLDRITAFFCCIPGGASEAIALSKDYGANQQIVAAFHSTRIVLFVLVVPFIISTFFSLEVNRNTIIDFSHFHLLDVFVILILCAIAIVVSNRFKIPAGALLYSMILGFILNNFIFSIPTPPQLLTVLGQVLIGGYIGLRFTKESLFQLKRIGPISVFSILCLFIISLIVSLFFTMFTSTNYLVSILSLVPAGAGEMASIAYSLHLDASLVTTIQIARLVIVFLLIPRVASYLLKKIVVSENKIG